MNIPTRFVRLREYARRMRLSINRLFEVITEIARNAGQVLRDVVEIFRVILIKGLDLLRLGIVDIVKGITRAVIDIVKWPLERIILPISRWLSAKTQMILTTIQTRDDVALALLLVLIVGVVLCVCSGVFLVSGMSLLS